MPPRKHRSQSTVPAVERELAPSQLAEANPPPSLLDVIMERVLDQHLPSEEDQLPEGYGGDMMMMGGAGAPAAAAATGTGAAPPGPARHPERPVLSQAVLCGEIAAHSDAGAVRAFFEECAATATQEAGGSDPLKGRMIANADAMGLSNETMKVVGVFVELPKHFWVVLEAEPAYLHLCLTEIRTRLAKGAAARAAAQAQAELQSKAQQQGQKVASSGSSSSSPSALGSGGASSSSAAGGGGSSALLGGASALGGGAVSAQSGGFDGAHRVKVAFYADDVIVRTANKWAGVDLTQAPTGIAGGQQSAQPLDEYVVECVHALAELVTTQQSTSGALGGVRGGMSAMAETARLAKLASLTLPRDDLTEKMRDSGLFFSLEEFVHEFCTQATSVPVLYNDTIHPIEPEMIY